MYAVNFTMKIAKMKSIPAMLAVIVVLTAGYAVLNHDANRQDHLANDISDRQAITPEKPLSADETQVENLLQASQTPQVKLLIGLPGLDDPDDEKMAQRSKPLIEEMPPIPDDTPQNEATSKGVIRTLEERIERQDKLLHREQRKIEAYNEQINTLQAKLYPQNVVLASSR